jgi:hypothetical protein
MLHKLVLVSHEHHCFGVCAVLTLNIPLQVAQL